MMPPQIADLFDREWYRRHYPDVDRSGMDALAHFILHGFAERRQPNPLFEAAWYAARYDVAGDALTHYVTHGRDAGYWPHPLVDPDFIRREYGLGPEDDPLQFALHSERVDRVCSWFSRRDYLRANPDVVESGILPEVHFFLHGVAERRPLGPGLGVEPAGTSRLDGALDEFVRTLWESNTADGLRRVVGRRMPAVYVDQVLQQAAIDPDVCAAGAESLPFLWSVAATDLETRDLIDYDGLLQQLPAALDALVILPRLQIGGAEKYGANVLRGLRRLGLTRVALMTTDEPEARDTGGTALAAMSDDLRDVPVVDAFPCIGRTWKPETVLALLLLRSRVRHVFVINSDVGLRMVRLHGQALSSVSHLYCAFFSEAPLGRGVPFSVRYLRDVSPHATVVSDNTGALAQWSRRVGRAAASRFRRLPCLVDLRASAPVDARELPCRRRPDVIRALWVGRWEPFKATDIVCALARHERTLHIDAFGPIDPRDEHLPPPNVRRAGAVAQPSSLPLAEYDLFLFTSWFEGMPNVVLEMAAAGLPIVASDVGGLRETFSDASIDFVSMTGSVTEIVSRFAHAIQVVVRRPSAETADRLTRARRDVEQHHGLDVYLERLGALISEQP